MATAVVNRPISNKPASISMLAHNYWASVPPEERFWTVADAYEVAREQKNRSQERVVVLDKPGVKLTDSNRQLSLYNADEPVGVLSNWAYRQMAGMLSVPVDFVTSLPAALANQVLNHQISVKAPVWGNRNILSISENDTSRMAGKLDVVRSINSDQYGRIWDTQPFAFAAYLQERFGFKVPPARPAQFDPRSRPATAEDLVKAGNLSLSIKVGDTIAPGGVYKGESYSFCILVDDSKIIDDGTGHPLFRAVMLKNSEVGGKYTFDMMFFLLKGICGNHIIHDMQLIKQVKIRHRGAAEERAEQRFLEACEAANKLDVGLEASLIENAKNRILGKNEEEVVEFLQTKKIVGKKAGQAAYGLAETREDWYGNPRSAWGIGNAISEMSQQGSADERYEMDQAVGTLLRMN